GQAIKGKGPTRKRLKRRQHCREAAPGVDTLNLLPQKDRPAAKRAGAGDGKGAAATRFRSRATGASATAKVAGAHLATDLFVTAAIQPALWCPDRAIRRAGSGFPSIGSSSPRL